MKLSQSGLFCFSLVLLLSFLAYGQEKIRKIEKKQAKDEPIELVSTEVGDKTLDNRNQVSADKDWLKNTKLNLKNISKKPIVYMKVYLQVEPQGKMQHPFLLPLIFGNKSLPTNTDVAKLKVLKQNESVKISLKPYIFETFSRFMQKNEIQDVDRVEVFFDFIVFDDGTAWSKGQRLRRNPNDSNRWDVVNNSSQEVSPNQNQFTNTTLKLINSWQSNSPSFLLTDSSFFCKLFNAQNRCRLFSRNLLLAHRHIS